MSKLVVVGGGSAGYHAAFLAADLGLSPTLVLSDENPGGTCLYHGCIPSKALLHAASVMDEAKGLASIGIDFTPPKISLEKLRAWKEGIIEKLSSGLNQLCEVRKIEKVYGHARFIDSHTMSVQSDAGEEKLSFENVILAAGARPVRLPAFSLLSGKIWDSTAALDLKKIPKRLLVIGGGFIGLELGTFYASFGSKVVVAEMMPSLLPGVDRDLVNVLTRKLKSSFEAIRLQTKVSHVEEEGEGFRVSFSSAASAGEGKEEEAEFFDNILLSAGRKPNTDQLGLENTRIQRDDKGFIRVDAARRTEEKHIFAIGDITGNPMLAHKASAEARVAVEVISGKDSVFKPKAIPAVVYTNPEIATCGLTEIEAKDQGRKVKVVRFPWAASGRALTLGHPEGHTKLLIDPENEKILGAGIVGFGAGELIEEAVLAVELGLKASDIKSFIHPHPSLSETILEAAEVYYGQSPHLHRPSSVIKK